MSIVYKTLLEIKLLHEYYLTTRDGSTVFEQSSQAQRMAFLENESRERHPSINEDIRFEFPETLKEFYEGYHLKLIPSYSGCKLVGRVTPVTLASNAIVYQPFIPFPAAFPIFISMARKNSLPDSYTNQRIKRSTPSVYFFSSQDLGSTRTFPFLTGSIPSEDNATEYEQGELSLSATNTIREFYRQAGTSVWNDVTGTGFANESDRILLPARFEYHFGNSTALTEAEFILRDASGVEVSRILANNNSGLGSRYTLDFSGKITQASTRSFQPATSLYQMEVRGNNGYSASHRIIFGDELLKSDPWGLIHINATAANDFSLFAPDGFIIRRRTPLGIMTPAPVFEIPVKSRFAYWRFINDKGKELNIPASLADYVDKEGNALITKKPRSIARHWFLLEKDPPPGTVYISNPLSYDAKRESDSRLFFDVIVPQSALFPVI